MQHVFIAFLLAAHIGLSAQPISHLTDHRYESFYQEFRREKIKTSLSNYDASGPVKKMTWTFEPSTPNPYGLVFQVFNFSRDGLLTGYTWNDTSNTTGDKIWNRYAESWKLYYDSIRNLDTLRIAEFHDIGYNEVYWQAYNSEGYLASCGQFSEPGQPYQTFVEINYVYTRFDSFLSVTTSPFSEYDITGNVIGDSVHFVFDEFGRVCTEKIFRFGSDETITFTWSDDYSFRYGIGGRSYMGEGGEHTCNSAGKLIRSTSHGYHIDQMGTHSYSHEDSLAYNKQGWISAEYKVPQAPQSNEGTFIWTQTITSPAKVKVSNVPESRFRLYRRYSYTVDTKGNWITRSHYDVDDKLIGKEVREISYY